MAAATPVRTTENGACDEPETRQSRRRDANGTPRSVQVRDPRFLTTLRAAQPDPTGKPLTQRQAAQAIGISHGHLADIELGKRRPSLRVAERIAEFYRVNLDALFSSDIYRHGADK